MKNPSRDSDNFKIQARLNIENLLRAPCKFPHVTCATDYIGRVTERNEFHWVHYDLDGPAHLDPIYTGTGIYYRSIY